MASEADIAHWKDAEKRVAELQKENARLREALEMALAAIVSPEAFDLRVVEMRMRDALVERANPWGPGAGTWAKSKLGEPQKLGGAALSKEKAQ